MYVEETHTTRTRNEANTHNEDEELSSYLFVIFSGIWSLVFGFLFSVFGFLGFWFLVFGFLFLLFWGHRYFVVFFKGGGAFSPSFNILWYSSDRNLRETLSRNAKEYMS